MVDDPAVVVIGGGQAGLAVGYHSRRTGVSFVILDSGDGTPVAVGRGFLRQAAVFGAGFLRPMQRRLTLRSCPDAVLGCELHPAIRRHFMFIPPMLVPRVYRHMTDR